MQSADALLSIYQTRGSKGLPLERVYRQLFNPELYLLAYGKIYRNQGAMTPGATQETVDGMNRSKGLAIIAAIWAFWQNRRWMHYIGAAGGLLAGTLLCHAEHLRRLLWISRGLSLGAFLGGAGVLLLIGPHFWPTIRTQLMPAGTATSWHRLQQVKRRARPAARDSPMLLQAACSSSWPTRTNTKWRGSTPTARSRRSCAGSSRAS